MHIAGTVVGRALCSCWHLLLHLRSSGVYHSAMFLLLQRWWHRLLGRRALKGRLLLLQTLFLTLFNTLFYTVTVNPLLPLSVGYDFAVDLAHPLADLGHVVQRLLQLEVAAEYHVVL